MTNCLAYNRITLFRMANCFKLLNSHFEICKIDYYPTNLKE